MRHTEQFDANMAQRVWQRVQQTPDQDPLPGLIAQVHQAAQLCAGLQKHYRGKEAQLKQMHTQLQRQAACLQGIHYLKTGSKSQAIPLPATADPPQAAARHCLGHCLRLSAAYRRQCDDSEYGSIFSSLAQQTTAHAQLLLELLGK